MSIDIRGRNRNKGQTHLALGGIAMNTTNSQKQLIPAT